LKLFAKGYLFGSYVSFINAHRGKSLKYRQTLQRL
jgi:hypothetical protein